MRGGIHVSPYDTWNSKLGYTGIGINFEGHSFIVAIADDIIDEYNDLDLSIKTKKNWSKSLYEVDIPNLENINNEEEVLQDFSSKKSTDVILAALATSNNPDEIDNAAVVARNYSKGCIGKGQWSLPSGGILNIIHQLRPQINDLVKWTLNNFEWTPILTYHVWTCNEYNADRAWYGVMYTATGGVDASYYLKYDDPSSYMPHSAFVLPVYTLE